ncbi:amidase signature enzyme [Mollisia scopiformis]|uniref:Amidase signature enzyme n=1 Tax=Mollisia scopiformis TaxID=149040 RepID=A0A194XJI2_MOLSC|nr:amidase signature enzyme [Mollisia scopiformis]KUJ20308.1 amidase signature enzyme [Mollisia scopiformis]
MVLQLSAANVADVDEIAAVHLAAFDSNILLHAQFPTSTSLDVLRFYLSQEMLASIQGGRQSGKAVFVVRDTEANDKIVSFAKWDLPGPAAESPNLSVQDITCIEGCNKEYLDQYVSKAEAAKFRVVGNKPCYRLTFVGTLPKYQGRGAGRLLTEWGLEKAKQESMPIYLESTISAARLYRRLGFTALDGLSMSLPGRSSEGGPNVYEEVGMLKTWDENADEAFEYWDSSLNITSLYQDYDAGIKPQQVIQAIYDRIDAYKDVQPSVWTHLQPFGDVLRAANELHTRWPNPAQRPPLWGIPFSVKDSIDVAGVPTTIGCPALSTVPNVSAPVFQHCIDAGGLFVGKTNMEQLATGMTGCRSPYGTLHSTFSKMHIVGGSSSGSAVTVSEGLVSFSLGSDTAGSIRVPALFNGILGFKPTKGTVSARGVAPACIHQDCVSFLATSIEDVERIWKVCKGFDKQDFFAKLPSQLLASNGNRQLRLRFGVPPLDALQACSLEYRRLFSQVVETLSKNGAEMADLEWQPFEDANELLYNSTFVLERLTILPDGWFEKNKQLLHPVTRQVFEGALARNSTAVDVFKDLHKQAKYKRAVENILRIETNAEDGIDELTVMVVPTTPFHPTIEEVAQDPLGINGQLGQFAHFANVLDLVAVAVPCGTYETAELVEGRPLRLPFGVTILAGTGLDAELLKVVAQFEEVLGDLGQDEM